MKTPNNFFVRFIFCVALTCAPASALAAVQITEIMYDVSGTDTGREWVEITNTGSSAVDVSGYKFFEANTNHGITVLSGSAVLAPGGVAVIVDDATKFAADWPAFSGVLLKSSFSLSNTGESLALKDSALVVQHSVTYDGSMGAAGDGNSLHLSGTTFTPGVADPGVYSGGASSPDPIPADTGGSSSSTSTSNTTTQQASAISNIGPEPLVARIKSQSVVMVGGGSFFTGSAFDLKGTAVANARYIWNFGDGATDGGQTVFHTYVYPGKYAVILTVASGDQAGLNRITIEAAPAQVGLLAEPDGSLMVLNRSSQELNIGLWSVSSGTSTFVIPQDTLILSGQSVRFATSVMHMYANADATLRYTNGAAVGTAVPHEETIVLAQPIPVAVVSQAPAARALVKNIPTVKSTVAAVLPVASTSLAGAGASGVSLPLWTYVLGLGGLLLIGVAGASYMRFPGATKTAADEFEIE
ncbi:MAG: lamin tail domain-containing protein [Candidatus Adlerbacteria bacterium]